MRHRTKAAFHSQGKCRVATVAVHLALLASKSRKVRSFGDKGTSSPLQACLDSYYFRSIEEICTALGTELLLRSASATHQRLLPSITCIRAVASSKWSSTRALAPIRRVLPSQLLSGLKSGLSLKGPQSLISNATSPQCQLPLIVMGISFNLL